MFKINKNTKINENNVDIIFDILGINNVLNTNDEKYQNLVNEIDSWLNLKYPKYDKICFAASKDSLLKLKDEKIINYEESIKRVNQIYVQNCKRELRLSNNNQKIKINKNLIIEKTKYVIKFEYLIYKDNINMISYAYTYCYKNSMLE